MARRLGIAYALAVGYLELLFHFVAVYAPRGDVGRHSDDAIAEAVTWPTERPASELIEALVSVRYLDRSAAHRLVVHDWFDHAVDAVHMKLARAGQYFAGGETPRYSRIGGKERKSIDIRFGIDGSASKTRSRLGNTTIESVRTGSTRDAHGVHTTLSSPLLPSHSMAAGCKSGTPDAWKDGTAPPAREVKVLAEALWRCRGAIDEVPMPDTRILSEVLAAAPFATPAQIAGWLLGKFAGRPRSSIKSYGLFPEVVRDELTPTNLAKLSPTAPVGPEDTLSEEDRCQACADRGAIQEQEFAGALPPLSLEVVKSMKAAGTIRLCSCERGNFWAELLKDCPPFPGPAQEFRVQ